MKIILENVSKTLDHYEVLKKINLEMKSGFIYGLVGRNGSGKSILLKTICGFLPPSKGRVMIEEKDIYKENVFPEKIAALLDKPSYLPDLNACDNLKLIASIKKQIGEKEIKEALKVVNLPDDKKEFKKYSLGMKQKLGIAQVIMENPDIMILDEPFNGIEEETTQKLREFLKKKKEEGKLIIIATHIKEDIEDLCDIVYEMKLGEITK